jgi:hypothetical protein
MSLHFSMNENCVQHINWAVILSHNLVTSLKMCFPNVESLHLSISWKAGFFSSKNVLNDGLGF